MVAARPSLAFFLIGAVTLVPLIVLGGGPHYHPTVLIVIAGVALAWGICSLLVIDWERAPPILIHLTVMGGLG